MKNYSDDELVALIREVDVPEPSPLFWDHLSQRVRTAVASEPVPQAAWRTHWVWVGGVIATLAVLVLAVTVTLNRNVREAAPAIAPDTGSGVATVVATELPPLEDDVSLAVVGELASQMDWSETGLSVTPDTAERAFTQLSLDEQRTAVELLQQEIKKSKSL
jgi:hypothetical protein